jgi:hypothetical protein
MVPVDRLRRCLQRPPRKIKRFAEDRLEFADEVTAQIAIGQAAATIQRVIDNPTDPEADLAEIAVQTQTNPPPGRHDL